MIEFMTNYGMIIGYFWAFCFAMLGVYSFFNMKEVTVGELVVGIVFAPIAFIVCYGDWQTVVIRWPAKKERS